MQSNECIVLPDSDTKYKCLSIRLRASTHAKVANPILHLHTNVTCMSTYLSIFIDLIVRRMLPCTNVYVYMNENYKHRAHTIHLIKAMELNDVNLHQGIALWQPTVFLRLFCCSASSCIFVYHSSIKYCGSV